MDKAYTYYLFVGDATPLVGVDDFNDAEWIAAELALEYGFKVVVRHTEGYIVSICERG